MKTATASYLTESRKLEATVPVKLFKIYYTASLFLLLSDRDVTLGADIYKPRVKEIDSISFSLPNIPGLGKMNDCSITLFRNSADTDLILSNPARGQKVLIWQWFDGLVDADKLSIASLIIDSIEEITQSSFRINCISPEEKLKVVYPNQFYSIAATPELFPGNEGVPKPKVLGDFSYTSLPQSQEYLQCNKPATVPVPAFWVDIKNRIAEYHLQALFGFPATGANIETMQWNPDWENYSFCRDNNSTNKVWAAISDSSKDRIDFNSYYVSTNAGSKRYTYFMPDNEGLGNTVVDWKNAIDLNSSTVATLALAGDILMLIFTGKSDLDVNAIRSRKITLNVVTAPVQLSVNDGFIDGDGNIVSTTFRGSIFAGQTGYRELAATPNAPDQGRFINYFIKIFQDFSGVTQLDGVSVKLLYNDYRGTSTTIFRERSGWGRGFELLPSGLDLRSFTNDIFVNSKGLNHAATNTIDSKTYDYRSPVYMLQFFLRGPAGYFITDLDYSTFDVTDTTLTGWQLANSLIHQAGVEQWLEEILRSCSCWLYWSASGWKLISANISLLSDANIRTFSDQNPDTGLSPSALLPMSDFVWSKTKDLYNRFIYNWDYEFATGNLRNNLVNDQANKSELATSVTTYGFESEYPDRDYPWIRRQTEINNLYTRQSKMWKDSVIEIEFSTNLSASILDVGDNIRVDHTAQNWTPSAKDFQIKEMEITGNKITIKAREIIP